jgi:hypothetical protein
MNKNKQTEWMSDPLLKDIDKHKLDFLQSMVFESNSLTPDAMLPFMLATMKRGQKKKMSFNDEEIELIVSVLKKYSSPEDLEKINMVLNIRKTGTIPNMDMLKNHPMLKNMMPK